MKLFENTEELVTGRLESYWGLICHAHNMALIEIMEHMKPLLKDFKDGTLASIIHDLVVKKIKIYFKDHNKKMIYCLEDLEYFMLVFDFPDVRIFCRFNKFDEKFLTSKTLTISARNFDMQKEPTFFDNKFNINLYAGYNLSVAYSGINCYISYPNGIRKNDWAFCINSFYSERLKQKFTEMFENRHESQSKTKILPLMGTGTNNKKSKRVNIKKKGNNIRKNRKS